MRRKDSVGGREGGREKGSLIKKKKRFFFVNQAEATRALARRTRSLPGRRQKRTGKQSGHWKKGHKKKKGEKANGILYREDQKKT